MNITVIDNILFWRKKIYIDSNFLISEKYKLHNFNIPFIVLESKFLEGTNAYTMPIITLLHLFICRDNALTCEFNCKYIILV